jgi:hypothetical protein
MRAVEVLCFGDMGIVLNSGVANDIAALLNRRVILELDALTNADKIFLIESLLLWIHHYRLAQDQREDFKHAIILEEAHHVLLRKKQEVTGEEAVTDILLREIRELGEAIIVLDQHPSLISKPALGNTYTTFCFNLKHRGDINMIQDSLHLDSEQVGYLGRLEVGHCVVRLQGRWFFPFLVRLPFVKLAKGSVTDAAIRERGLKQLASRSATPAPQIGHSGLIPASPRNSSRAQTRDTSNPPIPRAGKQDIKCTIQLTTQELAFLRDVHERPTSSVTDRYRRLSLSSRRGNSLQSSLLSRSLISSTSIKLPTGQTKLLELKEEGRQALGINENTTSRQGGPLHRYWVHRIAEHLRASCSNVRIEVPVGGGKTIDVVAERNGKRTAYEIETGKSDVPGNVRKCLEVGINRVVIVALTRHVQETLERLVSSDPRVQLTTVGDVAKP